MVNPLGNEKMYGFLKTAMDAATVRHQIISSNLANIDTPGYKARDLDFDKILQDFQDQENMMPTYTPEGRSPMAPPPPLEFKDYIDETEKDVLTERFDGNNVDLEKQVANLATARGRFQVASMLMNRKIRLLNEVINSK